MQDRFLITVDFLRADHVRYRGYERETTPTIDSLADDGDLFTKYTGEHRGECRRWHNR